MYDLTKMNNRDLSVFQQDLKREAEVRRKPRFGFNALTDAELAQLTEDAAQEFAKRYEGGRQYLRDLEFTPRGR